MWIIKILLIMSVTLLANPNIILPLDYRSNDLSKDLLNTRIKGSHIKVFIPSIPYTYLSKLINGTLFRINDSSRGWEYMMATSYKKIDALTYDITLRKNVRFQDGTPFDATSVINNIEAFIQQPFTYTDIHNRLKSIKKIDDYKVRFFLKKPYGMFLSDLARINLYSDTYLKKFRWKGQATGDNTQEAGKYGLGPYTLIKGYATGREQTPIVELEANPYYYEQGLPYIEKITIYTQLKMDKAVDMALNYEGELDITPIPFNKKTEASISKYAKLLTKPSKNNIAIYFNLMKPNGLLKDRDIRVALNMAINQENLLNFVYKKEGYMTPTAASINYDAVKKTVKDLKPYGSSLSQENIEFIKQQLFGKTFHVVTQDRFMFLWKGVEYQLKQYGVNLTYTLTSSEKDIYQNLLTNRENPKEWDMLTWGNDDWYGNHPWTAFFAYRTSSQWSAIDEDRILQKHISAFFDAEHQSPLFLATVSKIIHRVYEQAYMMFVPSPNLVLAINKEVDYRPSSVALMPLWKTKITKFHWSLRKGIYPKPNQTPMIPIRE